jgi:hypothetical protein
MTAAYDEIVTLGCDCTVTVNLRLTFGLRNAFPFDWWTTPLPSLVEFLKDPSVEMLYHPALLEPQWRGNMLESIRNRYYGIELRHEFPRDEEGGVRADWADHLDAPRSRSEHLMRRLLGLPSSASKVLFVRAFKESELELLSGRVPQLTANVCERLAELLPGLEFQLLLIDPPARVDYPGVRSLHVADPNKGDWRGTPKLWRRHLLSSGITWTGADRNEPDASFVDPDIYA